MRSRQFTADATAVCGSKTTIVVSGAIEVKARDTLRREPRVCAQTPLPAKQRQIQRRMSCRPSRATTPSGRSERGFHSVGLRRTLTCPRRAMGSECSEADVETAAPLVDKFWRLS